MGAPLKPLNQYHNTVMVKGFQWEGYYDEECQSLGQLYAWPWGSDAFCHLWSLSHAAESDLFLVARIQIDFWILVNKIWIVITVSNWFGTKRISVWFQINKKIVIAVWTTFKGHFSVYIYMYGIYIYIYVWHKPSQRDAVSNKTFSKKKLSEKLFQNISRPSKNENKIVSSKNFQMLYTFQNILFRKIYRKM